MRWILSPKAYGDLDGILAYVEESANAEVANQLLNEFETAFGNLAKLPGMGRIRQELTGSTLRWWRVQSYLIVYEPSAEALRIIRVIHGARDLLVALREEGA